MIYLKRLREEAGFTQWRLSELSNVPQSTISAIEREERPNPGILTLYMLAIPLKCQPTDIVTYDAAAAQIVANEMAGEGLGEG